MNQENHAPLLPIKTIDWAGGPDGSARIVDQTLLPSELRYVDIGDVHTMWEAIRMLRVRGAPAIGIAAAFGAYLALRASPARDAQALRKDADEAAGYLATSRPTAVNLTWALERVRAALAHDPPELDAAAAVEALKLRALDLAIHMIGEDNAVCRSIGLHAAPLVADHSSWLTHCNAGGLATAQWGTALSLFYIAAEQGKHVRVYADETRPLLQGARLTAFELQRAGIPVTVITDSMAATVMAQGMVHAVVVGTDRVAANGDFANKIGTLGVAVLAREYGLPFYVAAPTSSIDMRLASGDQIPIEERKPEEVTHGFGRQTAPDGIAVYNPAFDVTPARYVTAFITERGLAVAPFGQSLSRIMRG